MPKTSYSILTRPKNGNITKSMQGGSISLKPDTSLFIQNQQRAVVALGTDPLLIITTTSPTKTMSTLPKYGNLIFNSKSYTVAAQINPKIDGPSLLKFTIFINCNYKTVTFFKGEENMLYMDFINNSLKIYEIPESTRSKIKKIVYHPKRDEFFGLFGHHTGENQDFKVIDKSIIFENPFLKTALFFCFRDQALSIPYITFYCISIGWAALAFVFKRKHKKRIQTPLALS